jgi:hypothetical protein
MKQNVPIPNVQHLMQIDADLHKQMIELEKLRNAVRLAEASKPPQKLRRPRIDPKVIDLLVRSQLGA